MDLAKLCSLLSEVKQVISFNGQEDESVMRIVKAEIINGCDGYSLAIGKMCINDAGFSKLAAIAERRSLSIVDMGHYWMLCEL